MKAKTYVLHRHDDGLPLQLDIQAPLWRSADVARIEEFPWQEGGFRPNAVFRAVYDSQGISVLYEVQDCCVRCLETEPGGKVWEDACVELFFSTGYGYFNVEANCGGTLLVAWQTARGENRQALPVDQIRSLPVLATAPKTIDAETEGPYAWSLAFRLPFKILGGLSPFESPRNGQVWRGNFYKCAENSSNTHWGSWSPILLPKPDFHRPEFFGDLVFG